MMSDCGENFFPTDPPDVEPVVLASPNNGPNRHSRPLLPDPALISDARIRENWVSASVTGLPADMRAGNVIPPSAFFASPQAISGQQPGRAQEMLWSRRTLTDVRPGLAGPRVAGGSGLSIGRQPARRRRLIPGPSRPAGAHGRAGCL